MKKSDTLYFDLAVTGQCNMRCAYCSESGMNYENKLNAEIIPTFISFIDGVLKSTFFKDYENLVIAFWGGEPTLKYQEIIEVVTHFKNDDRVKFMLYTNGFKIPDSLKDLLLSLKDVKLKDQRNKFYVQISYDGSPIHDLKRVKIGGGSTSKEVLESIKWVRENGVPYSLKSTITVDTLKYLYEAFLDVTSLSSGGLGEDYFPTLDYYNAEMDHEFFEQHLEDMKLNLKKIAAHILNLRKRGVTPPTFKWFNSSAASCTAGIDLFAIDVDGKVYACHGCFYTITKNDHFAQTIFDDNLDGIVAMKAKHGACFGNTPEECNNCEALFCVRCNAVRYSVSEKETFKEKWNDYTNRPDLCRVYKEAGLIGRAFKRIEKQYGLPTPRG